MFNDDDIRRTRWRTRKATRTHNDTCAVRMRTQEQRLAHGFFGGIRAGPIHLRSPLMHWRMYCVLACIIGDDRGMLMCRERKRDRERKRVRTRKRRSTERYETVLCQRHIHFVRVCVLLLSVLCIVLRWQHFERECGDERTDVGWFSGGTATCDAMCVISCCICATQSERRRRWQHGAGSVSFIAANTKRTFSLFDDHHHYMGLCTYNSQVFTHAKCVCTRAYYGDRERYVNT